jgi:hypothetical protein
MMVRSSTAALAAAVANPARSEWPENAVASSPASSARRGLAEAAVTVDRAEGSA